MNDLLPIGTVIKIKESYDKFIIIGRILEQDKYEYVCVMYPYGYLDSKDFIYIKQDDVNSIVFLGDINY